MFGTGILRLSLCLCCVSWDGVVASALGQNRSGYHELPPPVNLSLISYNFKTILTWAYEDKTPDATNFTVEARNYRTAQWELFSPCSNISSHSCDVTKAFSVNLSALSSYYAKVKAITHFQESQFALTDRFSFKENATLGAPTVDVTVHGQEVTLRCIFPHVEKLSTETGLNINNDFKCKICVEREGHNILANCSIKRSRLKFNVTQSRVTLCVSAQVNSEQWKMKAEWSRQKCFEVYSLNLQETLIILLAVVAFILGLATASILWKLLKKELVLPKSLILIVKAINPHVEKIEEDAVSIVIKYEEVIPVEHDLIFEEVAKPSTCPENREPHAVDLKYAGKICAYDRPQNLENVL
ncbi:interferon gamma receptor 1-like [Pristis pectinata]|uniref:interferon gamma receptor 1-like n=1 Tax=Pristis pectinata TaxID=685728 RepID=UPI00223E4C76|nr:interferon gamma receptor 1-like [Pristis pectinata]